MKPCCKKSGKACKTHTPLNPNKALFIQRLDQDCLFQQYQPGIDALLFLHQAVLLSCATDNPAVLVENTRSTVPYLWAITNAQHEIWGLACLDGIIPGRHAFLHGAIHPHLREHPQSPAIITKTALCAMRAAVQELEVLKIKLEFEADNRGAQGFAWRMGFQQEARLKTDILRSGQRHDVIMASLAVSPLNKAFSHG